MTVDSGRKRDGPGTGGSSLPVVGRPVLAVGLVLAMGAAVAVDVATGPFQSPRVLAAIFDELAHTMTALLLLSALPVPRSRALVVGALLGAVAVDADHVPGELGWLFLTMGTSRPYSHSLLSVALLIVVANLGGERWYRLALGAAFGLATHLLRDAATGGVPLFWPVSNETATLPYWAYAVVLLAAGAGLLWRGRVGLPDRRTHRFGGAPRWQRALRLLLDP